MKNTLLLVFTAFMVLLLASCSTLGSESTDPYDRYYQSLYTAETYSSLYENEGIDAFWPVLVVSGGDFMIEKATETAVVDMLRENGVEAYAYSDYNDIGEIDTTSFIRYIVFINYGDIYTYKMGGGIAQLYFDCTVEEHKIGSDELITVGRISGITSSEENEFLNYSKTIRYACTATGEAIADKFMSFVSNNYNWRVLKETMMRNKNEASNTVQEPDGQSVNQTV